MSAYVGKISLWSPKIDGFENLPVKIDGFGRTHRTHADGAPVSTLEHQFRGDLDLETNHNLMKVFG